MLSVLRFLTLVRSVDFAEGALVASRLGSDPLE